MKTRHGKYKVPRTKISVEKGPPSIAESCEISVQHSYRTERRPGTTRLLRKFYKKWKKGNVILTKKNHQNGWRPKLKQKNSTYQTTIAQKWYE
jgi:hypothetical protein